MIPTDQPNKVIRQYVQSNHIVRTIFAGDVPNDTGAFEHLKCLTRDNPESVGLQANLTLPFAPYIGLSINAEIDGRHLRSGAKNSVTWFQEEEKFCCWVNDEKPYNRLGYQYTYEYLVNAALSAGWAIVE